jgi:Na+-driven multidrug efflux pump
LASSFQAAGRPLWPLIAITGRASVVMVGGWTIVHLTDTGLDGLAAVAAAGLMVYGAILALAFRAGFWGTPQPPASAASAKS